MRLVGCLQFAHVSVQTILNPVDDPEERRFAYLSAVFGAVHIWEDQHVTFSDPPGLRQFTFDYGGENGRTTFAKDKLPVIPDATGGALAQPVDALLYAPLFDRPFHLSSAPNDQHHRFFKPRAV